MADQKTETCIVTRQDDPGSGPCEETFEILCRPNRNVISGLMSLRKNAVMVDGNTTTPVKWDMNCLEEVCGECSMVINGYARQSCSPLVDQLEQPVRLEPMSTFPVVRDLIIDRERMFDALKQIKAWIPID